MQAGRPDLRGRCFITKAGDGECANPCPSLSPSNGSAWGLFQNALRSVNYRGMDGMPAGFHLCCVESAASALGIPWDEGTLKKFGVLEDSWLKEVHRKYESEREKQEAKVRNKR